VRVLVKEGDAVLADLTFEDEQVYVGSDPACAIHLPDMRVSARNALIAPVESGQWRIESLDYSNAILVNDHALIEPRSLDDEDEVSLHGYLLKVYLSEHLDQRAVEADEGRLGAEDLAKIRQYPLPTGSIVKRHFDGITMVKAQLDQASNLGVEVSHCRDIHELIDIALGLLLKSFDARSAWIGIRRQSHGELEVVGGRLPSGQSTGVNPVIDLLQYRCCERNQYVCIRKVTDQPDIGSAMAVPLSTRKGTFGMVYVDRRPRTRRFQIPDLDLLTAFGSTVAAKLDTLLQGRMLREAAVSSTEVSVVQAIQTQLDPKAAPSWANLQMAAYSRSGQEAPGDVYDVMKRPDSEITAILLGHVRSRGASLALAMARVHSTFRVAMLHNDSPHAFARQLNWLVYDERDPSLVDVMCVLIDARSGKIQHCRAGKIGAFVVDARGEPRKLATADGPSIGAVRNYEYLSKSDTLAPGETLAIYTRGVATPTNPEGERFGEARFIQLVCDGFGQPPSATVTDISHDLSSFFTDGRHPDDITVILLHHKEGG